MKILAYDKKKEKLVKVGDYDYGTRIFHKVAKANHLMEMFESYGIQENVIEQLKERGCEKIILKTPTRILESSFSDWLTPDIKVMDFGHGKQRFLPVSRFKNNRKENG